ncbi:DUF397 domain-containing protein [Salinispora arenicola]|uniref:DUF397 domain-containing protein n=1 Tax=Salinispora arenicola TaxID=168697 RepID=A0A542XMX5_SALAC|nr:DUF397 domain-containing protein [Salinispora arenicola]MCN0152104.1 DUF397 domain-containing protein [Salinispora arenicola]TQL37209.1 uncharacterized protein DUF397 [Salinispora arenicola]GIM82291.1 DUF397 domain-containing protein [Salinispora arenicola]
MNEINDTPTVIADLARTTWRKSTRSQTSNCVEVAPLPATVALRDSKDRGGPVLLFDRSEWRNFLAAAKEGQLDRT